MSSNGEGGGLVLLAYDGSDQAKHAIEQAGKQLGTGRAAIVLTVWQPVETIAYAGFAAGIGEMDTELKEQAESVAAEGAELARAAGFEPEPVVERGAGAWEQIVDLADQREAELIVVGSRGRSAIRSVLVGSVATAVVWHTKRPVLVVH